MKRGIQGAMLVFFSVCSFTTAAVVVPSEVIGNQELNAQDCVDTKTNKCIEDCHYSEDRSCPDNCADNAEKSCQYNANQ